MKLKEYLLQNKGQQKFIGDQLGASKQYFSQLVTGASPISPKRAVLIEKLTDGQVSRKDLRTDWKEIWPELR